jgi:hypothetical protein
MERSKEDMGADLPSKGHTILLRSLDLESVRRRQYKFVWLFYDAAAAVRRPSSSRN